MPAQRPLELQWETRDGDHVVFVRGELDFFSSAEVRRLAEARQPAVAAVDISGVTFIDSAGYQALVAVAMALAAPIENPSRSVQHLLDVLGRPDGFGARAEG